MSILKSFYRKNHKKLLILSIGLVVLSLFIILLTFAKTGDFIEKDITLKGGITSTIYTQDTTSNTELEDYLSKNLGKEVIVRSLTDIITRSHVGFIVEVSEVDNELLKQTLKEKISFDEENYSVEEVGPSLGESFYRQMIWAIGVAFLFMAVAVFIAFRTPIPSLAVIIAVLTDIIFTLGVVNLFHIKLGTSGIAALLLLIGYSVDTDVLLTTKVLKRKSEGGDVIDRIFSSMSTGLTMTVTTITALTAGLFISSSPIIDQMFLIIIIGLFYDIFATYITNASLLIWYCKKKGIE